jgi:hypothetical protein
MGGQGQLAIDKSIVYWQTRLQSIWSIDCILRWGSQYCPIHWLVSLLERTDSRIEELLQCLGKDPERLRSH